MSFSERRLNDDLMGFQFRSTHCLYFFGTAECQQSQLHAIFPDLKFAFLKQEHGRDLVAGNSSLVQTADAHWTAEKNLALIIQTADCLPVLLGSETFAIAAHAGWRGVEQRLVDRCAEFLKNRKAKLDQVCIGPHIQAHEFEVGNDVATLLDPENKYPSPSPHPDPAKRWVNLSALVEDQIKNHYPAARPHLLPMSTLSDSRFHSYRRGKAKDARQYSFIARV